MILSLLLSLCGESLLASSSPPPRQTTDYTKDNQGKDVPCTIKFADLSYVGMSFAGKAECVYGETESVASGICRSKGKGMRLINPANPQYSNKGARGSGRNYNPDKYYYCVPPLPENDKRKACRELAQKNSKYLDQNPNIIFRWDQSRSSSDGDCLCSLKGHSEEKFSCAQSLPDNLQKECQKLNLQEVSSEEREALPAELKVDSVYACKCPANSAKKYINVNNGKEACSETKTVAKEGAVSEEPDKDLKDCMEAWHEKAGKCKSDALVANTDCDGSKQMSDEQREMLAASNIGSQMYINSKAGKGSQAECFSASLAATGVREMLEKANDTCESDLTMCDESCKEEEFEELEKRCKIKLAEAIRANARNTESIDLNQKYYSEQLEDIESLSDEGLRVCKTEAKKGKLGLDKLLDSVGTSLYSSLMCACQLASGGADCASIPTVSSCDTNPLGPGCGVYSAMSVCVPGAGYNAELCRCQTNPKEFGCPSGMPTGKLSFAPGTVMKPGGGNVGGPGGNALATNLKPSGADIELSSGEDLGGSSPLSMGNPSGGGSSGGGGGGGGGGSIGGGGGGDAANPPVAATPEDKGGGGLFNQAKTFMSNLFGGGKKKGSDTGTSKNTASAKNKSKVDPSKFRPTRGLASKSAFGSKNNDIWTMMNKCFVAATCNSTKNSFLEQSLVHK